VGETTGSACIGACRDAVVGCGVAFRDAVVGCGVAFCDAVVGGIVDVTTDSYHGEACRDAVLGGIMDVTTDPDCCCYARTLRICKDCDEYLRVSV